MGIFYGEIYKIEMNFIKHSKSINPPVLLIKKLISFFVKEIYSINPQNIISK
jgi:hypothetical protein